MAFLDRVFGDPNRRALGKLEKFVESINARESELEALPEAKLQDRLADIRKQHEGGRPLEACLADVFPLVREAAKRTLKQRHFDVQLMGGIALHEGNIAEMKTGEGKTLVATLPATLNALAGKGVHIVTVNDYLAKRDVQWMGPVYHALGLTVGCLQHEAAFLFDPSLESPNPSFTKLRPVPRRQAYDADITYGTNNEFGFDYLRDNMVPTLAHAVQRELHYAIVDEVDSILVDEARTPLIISAPAEDSTAQYRRYAEIIKRLEEGNDYNIDEKMRAVTLTETGISKVEAALGVESIYTAGGIEMVHHVEQALKSHALFKRDRDYVVKDNQVIIVDEFTGRLMFGRRYSEGLHQAIEAKEGVPIQQESRTLATITLQNYFRLYRKLAGMTGTAATESEEFHKIYGLDVIAIPTNKPLVRRDQTDSVYKTERGKFTAIVREIKRRNEIGQPLLVGTISIERNELLSTLLSREGIPHEVLNAKNHEKEAAIIAQAGRKAAVTVATNMAGRGVDIIFGGTPPDSKEAEEVRRVGGLHVIGTERHEARRIDNQLRGRSGRQGDPGSSQFFVSMEDDLMRIFGSDRMKGLMDRLGVPEDMPIENKLVSRAIEAAQKKVEGHNFDIRKHLVEYDDVMNKHREVVYAQRRAILESVTNEAGVKALVWKAIEGEIERLVAFHAATGDPGSWDLEEIYESVDAIFPIGLEARLGLEDIRKSSGGGQSEAELRTVIIKALLDRAQKAYTELDQRVGNPKLMRDIERAIYLRTIDTLWIEHLDLMDYLREGIGLRGYGQRDPLVEYKREAYRLYTELIANIQKQVASTIYKVTVTPQVASTPFENRALTFTSPAKTSEELERQTSSSTPTPPSAPPAGGFTVTAAGALKDVEGNKIGRNDPCPCGSGKKYKKCGLLNTEEHQQRIAQTRV